MSNDLTGTGFLRQSDILGDPKARPPKPAIIPVSPSTWWLGIREGRYPKPYKLSERCTAWRVGDIKKLIDELGGI